VAALIVPSLLFSLAHYYQGWKAVLKIWGFAVGLGLMFIITGSLWPVMIIHFIIDFGGGWMAMILGRKQD
jgi:membrane protease YdiL (CAAX protease family)